MKNILITGAGRGLGLEITKQELKNGNFVFATYRTLSDDLINLTNNYKNIKLIRMDVGNDFSVKAASDEIKLSVNKLDVVYNNAGVLNNNHKSGFFNLSFDISVLDIININTIGFLRVIQNFYSLINKNSMIVVITSGAGSIQMALKNNYDIDKINIPYYISKAGLNMVACLFKNNLEKLGAKIILIDPGRIKTDMGGKNSKIEVSKSAEKILLFAHNKKIAKNIFIDFNGNKIKL